MSNDIGSERCGAIAADTCVKVPAKFASTVDNGRVAATVATGMTVNTLNAIVETIGKAERTGSKKEDDRTDKESTNRWLAARKTRGESIE